MQTNMMEIVVSMGRASPGPTSPAYPRVESARAPCYIYIDMVVNINYSIGFNRGAVAPLGLSMVQMVTTIIIRVPTVIE